MISVNATKIYVNPQNVNPNLISGDTFKVDVMVDEVPNLYAFQFKLKFNPNILQATDVLVAPFLNKPRRIIMSDVNKETGTVTLAFTSQYPAESKNGGGTLATITFKVIGEGGSVLDLNDTMLTDDNFPIPNKISHEVSDGVFNIQIQPETTTTIIIQPGGGESDCSDIGNGAACIS